MERLSDHVTTTAEPGPAQASLGRQHWAGGLGQRLGRAGRSGQGGREEEERLRAPRVGHGGCDRRLRAARGRGAGGATGFAHG